MLESRCKNLNAFVIGYGLVHVYEPKFIVENGTKTHVLFHYIITLGDNVN